MRFRENYRAWTITPPSDDLEDNADRLSELLDVLARMVGSPLLFPEVQVELAGRAESLLAAVLRDALPQRHGNAKLPSPDRTDDLVREARSLIEKSRWAVVTAGGGGSARQAAARTRAKLESLFGYWIGSRLPLNATPRHVGNRTKACLAALNDPKDHGPVERSLRIVAALLETTPAMVRKLRKLATGRRGTRGGRGA